MAKVLSLLLSLLIILGAVPQSNLVYSADTPCSNFLDITYGYWFNNEFQDAGSNPVFPKGTTDIMLFFKEKTKGALEDGKQFLFGDIDWRGAVHPYSEVETASDGELTIVFNNKKDNSLITAGPHEGSLLMSDGSKVTDKKCTGIKYRIGVAWEPKDCRLELKPSTKAGSKLIIPIGTKINAYVSHAFINANKRFVVIYSGDYIDKSDPQNKPWAQGVAINDNGDSVDINGNPAPFSFWTNDSPKTDVKIWLMDPSAGGPICNTKFDTSPIKPPNTPTCEVYPIDLDFSKNVTVKAENLVPGQFYTANIVKSDASGTQISNRSQLEAKNDGSISFTPMNPPRLPEGNYKANVYDAAASDKPVCTTPEFQVKGPTKIAPPPDKVVPCRDKAGLTCTNSGLDISCDPKRGPGIKTAIGCIHTNPVELGKDLLKFGLGIGGGLSFLMMLFGAFQMMTSAGNPETLNTGRQRLTSAIIGLLFVILSILILQIIGWNILQLPGFGTK